MTSRPRGKRDQRPTENPRAAKSAPSGSGSSGKRSGGGRGRKPSGKASQRPPRVSRPPTVSDKPKKTTKAAAPAKPAPAPKKPATRSTRTRGQQSAAPSAPQQVQQPVMRAPVEPVRPPAPARQQRPQQQQQSQRPPMQGDQPRRGEARQPMPPRGPAPMVQQPGRAPASQQQGQGQRGPGGGQQQQYQQRPPMPPQSQRGGPQQGRPVAPAPMQGGQYQSGQRPMQGAPQGQRPQGQYPAQQPQQRGPGYGAPQGRQQRPMDQPPTQQSPRGQMPPQGGQRGPGAPSMGQQQRAPMSPPPQQGQRPFDQQRQQQGPGGPPRDQRGMMPQSQQRPPQAPLQPAMRESRPAPQEMARPPAPPQQPVQRQAERPTQQPIQQQQQRPPQQGQHAPQRPVMPMQGQPSNLYTPAPRPAQRAPAPATAPRPSSGPQAPARGQPPARDQGPARQQPPAREPARFEPPSREHGTQNGAPAILEPRPESRTVEPKPSAAPHVPAAGNVKPFPGKQDDVFDKTVRFSDLGLSPEALQGVTDAGFEFPTAIQARIIPLLLTGKDILGQAKTGTGKTAAFGLPTLSRIQKGESMSVIILVPTRELAIQVATDLTELGRHTGLTVLPVYGGQNIATQADRLRRGPEIIVATPGRLMDMQQRGYLHYHNIKIAILDEVDRMLDIGFRDDIRKILSACPKDRQTVFVSATLPPEVESLARSYARDAEKIVATTGSLTASMVKQWHLTVEPWDKKQLLLHLLTHESPALTIVFCRTKKTVDNLAEYMFRKGIDAHAIHGDMYQGKRNKVIEKLKSGKLSVLIASDLASRGLDVEGITHVINYDLPEDPDLYVHRIGRTARAGRDGVAWSLVTPEQGELLTQIEMLINAEIPKLDYPDFTPGPLPQDVIASRELDAKRAAVAKSFNRFAASTPGAIGHVASSSPADADPSKFPGGIVPSKLPERRLGGKVRTARSMKQAIAQTLMPGTQPKPTPEDGAANAAPDAPTT